VFLVELSHTNSNSTCDACNSTSAALTSTESTLEEQIGVFKARYAYLTTGVVMLSSSIPFAILYFYQKEPLCTKSTETKPVLGTPVSTRNSLSVNQARSNCFTLILLVLLFLFYYVYLYIENIPSAFFPTFAIKYLSWSVRDSTLLMSVFFGFHCGGRLLAIPLSIFMRPRTMIVLNLAVVAVAYTLLLFIASTDSLMWIVAAMAGLGMASTFASMVLWVSEMVPISGKVASVMLIGSSIGGATGPVIVGVLIDLYTPMWMVYVLISSGFIHIIIFVAMFLFFNKLRSVS